MHFGFGADIANLAMSKVKSRDALKENSVKGTTEHLPVHCSILNMYMANAGKGEYIMFGSGTNMDIAG